MGAGYSVEQLNYYHAIWRKIHSLYQYSFKQQINFFKNIIDKNLSHCPCGKDAEKMFCHMINYDSSQVFKIQTLDEITDWHDFWCAFHGKVSTKLGKECATAKFAQNNDYSKLKRETYHIVDIVNFIKV